MRPAYLGSIHCLRRFVIAGLIAGSAAAWGQPPDPTGPGPYGERPSDALVPRFVSHVPPEGVVDVSVFEAAGCTLDTGACAESGPLASMGCDRLHRPFDVLASLRPVYPIALCLLYRSGGPFDEVYEEGSFVYSGGGLLGNLVRYLIYRDGEFELVSTEEELREIFAPIESAGEALAFAVASRNVQPLFGLEHQPHLVYSTQVIEDSHSVEEPGGFGVHVYYHHRFGCGPHHTYAVEFFVSRSGDIEELSREAVFRDPRTDGLCVD